jgi:hypothetical protein
LAISFISREEDENILQQVSVLTSIIFHPLFYSQQVQNRFAVQIPELPEQIDINSYSEYVSSRSACFTDLSFHQCNYLSELLAAIRDS